MYLLEYAIEFCLVCFYKLTTSYEFSLILLSLAVSACLAPFYYLTGILEKKERVIQQRLKPFIQKINSVKNPKAKHNLLKELYWAFSYYPFYSLRSLASLFIQIPMLFAAYEALSNYAPLKDYWLGYPDNFFTGFNLLPFVMTFINLCAVFISSSPESKERKQGILIAMVFFVLLYTSPAALLIYWTFNQLFNLIRYLMVYPFPKIKRPSLNFNFAWQFLLVLLLHFLLTAFVGGKQSVYTYLVFAAFAVLVIYKFIAKAKISFYVPNLKTLALNISAMVFPAILIFKSNEIYFEGIDLAIYASALLLFSILVSFIFSPKFSVSFILTFMFLPMAMELTHYISELRVSFAILFAVVLIFVNSVIKQKGVIIAFFLVASIYPLFFIAENANSQSTKKLEDKDIAKIPKELAELELKDSASIYLFMHDAFPKKDYADYLNLPNYSDLMDVFEQNDFKIYDVYSMGYNTLSGMASVFNFEENFLPKWNGITTAIDKEIIKNAKNFSRGFHSGYLRAVMNGNSRTNMLLQKNGYSTAILDPHYDVQSLRGDKYYDFILEDKDFSDNTVKVKNQVLINILKGTLNSDMMQSSLVSYSSYLMNIAKFAQSNPEKKKLFIWGVGCPGHSTQGGLGSTEKEMQRFIPLYSECLEAMKEEIETLKSNPNAIIVFVSDHGNFLIDDGYRFTKNYDFSKVDYMKFRDIFGAFMAIRFPDKERAAKYDKNFNVSPDLFPIIFAYLFDSEIPLKYQIKNTELRLGNSKFDKGVFYKDFYKEEQSK